MVKYLDEPRSLSTELLHRIDARYQQALARVGESLLSEIPMPALTKIMGFSVGWQRALLEESARLQSRLQNVDLYQEKEGA